jgi:hypothetical protein|tara:strand:- start:2922 stop:4550 length:1629 start_codon:yes stop_codon:yes gene_type:complete
MAKTYYKVQPVAAQTQINWAEVGKNFSDMLAEDKRVKDEKRAALDEMSREAVNVINNVEDGQDATANQWWLAGGGEVTDGLLMANGLLKSGQISANQYVQMVQNANDGVDGLIGVFEKFNADYELKKERMGCNDPEGVGCSQKLESWAMEQVEGIGKFQNTAVVVNPETLMLSVVDLVDGKIVNDPNKVRSINSLQTMAGAEFNLFDLDAATKGFVDKVGISDIISRIDSEGARKGIKTVMSSPMFNGEFSAEDEDKLEKAGVSTKLIAELKAQGNIYFAAEGQLVQTIMADNLQSTSILTNSIGSDDNGNDYDFTYDKKRDEHEILMKQEGNFLVPDFTDEIGKKQLEKVKKFIKTDVRNQFDTKVTSTVEETTYRYTGRTNTTPTEPPEEETIPQKTLLEYALETQPEYNIPDYVLDFDVANPEKEGEKQTIESAKFHMKNWIERLPGMEGYKIIEKDNNLILESPDGVRSSYIDFDVLSNTANKKQKIKKIFDNIREISVENSLNTDILPSFNLLLITQKAKETYKAAQAGGGVDYSGY